MAKSKTIKQVASNMRSAETAELASNIAIDFLKSTDAQKTDSAQAGNFLAGLKEVFKNAPQQHAEVLNTVAAVNVSNDFKVFAGFALTDLQHSTKYIQQAQEVMIANAKILHGAKDEKPRGFEFAIHYGSDDKESDPLIYDELLDAQNAHDLEQIINNIMLEQDITEEKAPVFFKEIIGAIEQLRISPEQEDKLLSSIQQGTSSLSVLTDLIDDYINAKTDKSQGPSPLQNHIGVADFQPS